MVQTLPLNVATFNSHPPPMSSDKSLSSGHTLYGKWFLDIPPIRDYWTSHFIWSLIQSPPPPLCSLYSFEKTVTWFCDVCGKLGAPFMTSPMSHNKVIDGGQLFCRFELLLYFWNLSLCGDHGNHLILQTFSPQIPKVSTMSQFCTLNLSILVFPIVL